MDAIRKFEEDDEGGEYRKCAEQLFENRLQGREDCNCNWAVYEDMINVFDLMTLVTIFGDIQTPAF